MSHRPGLLRGLCLWCVSALFLTAGTTQAQDPPEVNCAQVDGGEVRCSINLAAWFAEQALRERLQSGFSNTLSYRLYVRQATSEQPVALTAQRFEVTYELWEERYFVVDETSAARLVLLSATSAESMATARLRLLATGDLFLRAS